MIGSPQESDSLTCQCAELELLLLVSRSSNVSRLNEGIRELAYFMGPNSGLHWKARRHNFPKLEHLCLWDCHELRKIPIDFGEILTLKSIELWRCLPSAVKSAKKIQDEQHEYGNNDMVVIEKETEDDLESEKSLSEEEPEVAN
nr:disease resistance protein RPP13-like isoform X6 [Ipomoea batatas]